MLAVTTLAWARMRKTRRVAEPMLGTISWIGVKHVVVGHLGRCAVAHPAPTRGRPMANTRSILPSTARLPHIIPHSVRIIVPWAMRSALVACARLVVVSGPLRSRVW